MDLLNVKVKHKMLGEGIVTNVEGNNFTVQFSTRNAKFIFPSAFENFLQATEEALQQKIKKEIEVFKNAEKEKRIVEEAAKKINEEKSKAEKASVKVSPSVKAILGGFGADYNVQHLSKHPILTYKQVEEQFGIRISGFGRGINSTPSSVVLISSIDKKKVGFVYHDHWTADGDYIYSGEGKNGNQTLTAGNKAIVDAEREGKTIQLFVKFSPQEYYYQGVFKLVDYNLESDMDESGLTRKEYKFRLRRAEVQNENN